MDKIKGNGMTEKKTREIGDKILAYTKIKGDEIDKNASLLEHYEDMQILRDGFIQVIYEQPYN